METKKRFAKALEQLLRKQPLDEIRVTDLVAITGLSRKTFYRHYIDKYDLAAWYWQQVFDGVFNQVLFGNSWHDTLLQNLTIYEKNAVMLKNIYQSRMMNMSQMVEIEPTMRVFAEFLQQKGADVQAPEVQFAIEIAARGGADMIMQWLISGMAMEKDLLCDLIIKTMPVCILRYLDAESPNVTNVSF